MDTDNKTYLEANNQLTHQIIGAAMQVLNTLGHGFPEKVYENALIVEFGIRGLPTLQQSRYDIRYKDHLVGTFVPDLIINNEIVVDTKCIDKIQVRELGQMINYLKVTKLRLGLIINFQRSKLEWERVIL